MDRAERIEALWSSFEIISAEPTLARQDPASTDEDIRWMRAAMLAIETHLAEVGCSASPTLPRSRIPQNYPNDQ